MHISHFIVLLCVLSMINHSFCKRVYQEASALSNIIDNFYEKYSVEINIIIVGETDYYQTLAEQIIKNSNVTKEFRTTNNYESLFDHPLRSYLVLSNDYILPKSLREKSFEEFQDFYCGKTDSYHAYKKLVIIHYCKNCEKLDIDTDSNTEHRNYLLLTAKYRLAEIRHYKKLKTLTFSHLFSPKSTYFCRDLMNWTVKYSFRKKYWISKDFLFENHVFKLCYFFIGIPPPQRSSPYFEKLISISYKEDIELDEVSKISGYLGDIAYLYAKKKNFTILIQHRNNSGDIFIPYFELYSHNYIAFMTFPIKFISFTFLATRGLPYSPTEKLILPFDDPTWIAIISSFIIGFLTILIVYQFPHSIQNFVFGRDNKSPSLCFAQIFFGIGLVHVADRNFARYHFMIFTLFCLIIRTAYQGKMFEFMTTDVRKPSVEICQDILDQNVTTLLQTEIDRKFFLL